MTAIDATRNKKICDRNETTENKLYYDGKDINSLFGLNPRCRDNDKHKLQLKQNQTNYNSNHDNRNVIMQCDDCKDNVDQSLYYYCRRCKTALCTLCCEDMLEDKLLQLEEARQLRKLQHLQQQQQQLQIQQQQEQQQRQAPHPILLPSGISPTLTATTKMSNSFYSSSPHIIGIGPAMTKPVEGRDLSSDPSTPANLRVKFRHFDRNA